MKLVLVTDAWLPQVNGVVSTLVELVRQLQPRGDKVVVIQPWQFRTRPCPGHPGIALALFPGRQLARMVDAANPDAIHIATEGPLGWAARSHCLRRGLPFTTTFHTRFPEILQTMLRVPLSWSYALLRRFHRPSSGVMVPTRGVLDLLEQRGFGNLREWTHGVDTRLFALAPEATEFPPLGHLARPVSLYVGRVAAEKNIEAFLALDVPGSKVVCGVGPLKTALQERYPNVHWLGVLPRQELAQVYAAADVFVFPCRNETFGQVMLEAMACGVPVAAYPVHGPLQVLGDAGAGAMREDLREAWFDALKVKRHAARAHAQQFSWGRATTLFASFLVLFPPRQRKPRPSPLNAAAAVRSLPGIEVARLSHKRHPAVE